MTVILTVDDSNSMRQMVSFTLKNSGYEVVEKCDGVEALDWAKRNPAPTLVISDVNMPNMDGITLIKHLRGLDGYQYIPILMLTTETSNERKQEGKNAGATGWIVKPFDPEKLINVIQKVLD